ncbi:hypothetical protein Lal_00033542 [Lupinus albus]|nr:hypothetical protein Lal_00033514 [Lupinus albus]KAF1884366.1 hypothetical protein Lal_00033542 [Lupinus albus]
MRLGDTGGMLEYLQQMKVEDPNFFYAIQVDEDDLITNIFWRDAKMMVDYSYFGDVVCFDTTYRKNKEAPSLASEVDLAESSSIAPKASCELMARRVGGRENLGFIPDDYKN